MLSPSVKVNHVWFCVYILRNLFKNIMSKQQYWTSKIISSFQYQTLPALATCLLPLLSFSFLSRFWGIKISFQTLFLEKQPPEVLCKRLFLEISQNSQGSTCARVSFIIKKTLTQLTLRTAFLQNTSRGLLLYLHNIKVGRV